MGHGNFVSCLLVCFNSISVSRLSLVLSLSGIAFAVKYKCRKGRKSETGKIITWTLPAVITSAHNYTCWGALQPVYHSYLSKQKQLFFCWSLWFPWSHILSQLLVTDMNFSLWNKALRSNQKVGFLHNYSHHDRPSWCIMSGTFILKHTGPTAEKDFGP